MNTSPFTHNRCPHLRSFALIGAALVALTACAKDATTAIRGDATDTTTPETTTPDTAGLGPGTGDAIGDVPAGPDQAVLRIETGVGGFRTFQSTFASIPSVLVTGDGRLFQPGPQIEIFPGPFLENIQINHVGADTLLAIGAEAKKSGLLGTVPDYTVGQPNVTDVGSTVVTLTVDGQTYVHIAFALGMEQAPNGARARLRTFVDWANNELTRPTTNGSADSEQFVAATYLLASQPVDLPDDSASDTTTAEPKPRLVAWPAETGVSLKDLRCASIDASKVQALFEKADQLTFFEDADVTYTVAVRPMLLGKPGCEAQ